MTDSDRHNVLKKDVSFGGYDVGDRNGGPDSHVVRDLSQDSDGRHRSFAMEWLFQEGRGKETGDGGRRRVGEDGRVGIFHDTPKNGPGRPSSSPSRRWDYRTRGTMGGRFISTTDVTPFLSGG